VRVFAGRRVRKLGQPRAILGFAGRSSMRTLGVISNTAGVCARGNLTD